MHKNKMAIIYRAQAIEGCYTYVYIGQTSRSLKERREEHEISALKNSSKPFHTKLNEIARNKWDWRELFACEEPDANDHEKKLISDYSERSRHNPHLIILNNSFSKTPP